MRIGNAADRAANEAKQTLDEIELLTREARAALQAFCDNGLTITIAGVPIHVGFADPNIDPPTLADWLGCVLRRAKAPDVKVGGNACPKCHSEGGHYSGCPAAAKDGDL